MAIKRLTIELDDSAENIGPTAIPPSLTDSKSHLLKEIESTDVTEYDSNIETNTPLDAQTQHITIGRTFPDLIVEFMKNPSAMATILIFVPFIIFVAKIDCIESLKYPLLTGLILNLVWFGLPAVIKGLRYIFGVRRNKSAT